MKFDFDLITFDCYGTLIDWEGGIINAFQTEAAKDGVSLDRVEIIQAYMQEERAVESASYRAYSDVLAETAKRVAARLGWSITEERAAFLPASLPAWEPFADTNEALERLAGRFELGILSNTDDDLIRATARHFTVKFDPVVTAEQVRSYKPGFAHFQEGLARAGEKRMLHAAQSYFHDVVPASLLKIPVVWVNRKSERAFEDGPQPSAEVSNLRELADLLGA
ncbi:MAG TPA: HAD-IA family hydrolase [Blastocatellia bacterium]|nr:HAD-IA family hydrolase [Blastocatellia bacterium]